MLIRSSLPLDRRHTAVYDNGMQLSRKRMQLNKASHPPAIEFTCSVLISQSTSTCPRISYLAYPPVPSCESCPSPYRVSLTLSATPVYTQELGIPCSNYVRSRKSHIQLPRTQPSSTLMRSQPFHSLPHPTRPARAPLPMWLPNPIHLPSFRQAAYMLKCSLRI